MKLTEAYETDYLNQIEKEILIINAINCLRNIIVVM